jgi:single-strand DNA-binding protein
MKRRQAMINKVFLIGNVGRDPETRNLESGGSVTSFSVATTMAWNDKKSGEKKELTEWHRIVTFNRLAEICGQYLSKGKLVFIEGRLHTRSWEQDGVTRYVTEVRASVVQMLNSKESASRGGSTQPAGNNPPLPPDTYPMDDDIPF